MEVKLEVVGGPVMEKHIKVDGLYVVTDVPTVVIRRGTDGGRDRVFDLRSDIETGTVFQVPTAKRHLVHATVTLSPDEALPKFFANNPNVTVVRKQEVRPDDQLDAHSFFQNLKPDQAAVLCPPNPSFPQFTARDGQEMPARLAEILTTRNPADDKLSKERYVLTLPQLRSIADGVTADLRAAFDRVYRRNMELERKLSRALAEEGRLMVERSTASAEAATLRGRVRELEAEVALRKAELAALKEPKKFTGDISKWPKGRSYVNSLGEKIAVPGSGQSLLVGKRGRVLAMGSHTTIEYTMIPGSTGRVINGEVEVVS